MPLAYQTEGSLLFLAFVLASVLSASSSPMPPTNSPHGTGESGSGVSQMAGCHKLLQHAGCNQGYAGTPTDPRQVSQRIGVRVVPKFVLRSLGQGNRLKWGGRGLTSQLVLTGLLPEGWAIVWL